MKKGWIAVIIAVILIAVIAFIGFRWFTNTNHNQNNGSQYQATRTLAENQDMRK